MTSKLKFHYKQYDNMIVDILTRSTSIPKPIIRLLQSRNIETEEDILDFLLKDYKLSNPFFLPDMKKSVMRIKKARDKGDNIIVFGDYDVDGMTASAILYKYLISIGCNASIHVPDKEVDGYGMTPSQIEILNKKENVDLIISVDTGTTAFEASRTCSDLGIDLIVTDHHEPSNELPNVFALINPKLLKKDLFKLKNLSGAGIAFFLVRALNSLLFQKEERKKLTDYLVLAALSSIGDMVPLLNDNRIIVDKGVALLFNTESFGLNKLLEKIKFYEYPSAVDIAFKINPILNSGARLGQPELSLDILTNDHISIADTVRDLLKLNTKRKKIGEEQLILAEDLIDSTQDIILLSSPDFHIGLIGLIAGRISNKYNKPTIVISVRKEGPSRASCRSIEGFDFKNFIEETKHLHLGGGGHKMAAGFSITLNQINKFKKYVSNLKPEFNKIKDIEVELTIEETEIKSYDLIKYLYMMEPFGQNNPMPIIRIQKLSHVREVRFFKNNHVKIRFNDLDLMLFSASEAQLSLLKRISSEDTRSNIIAQISSNGKNLLGTILDIELEKIN